MFMRFLQLKLNPEYYSDFIDFYKIEVVNNLQQTEGCLFAGLIRSNPAKDEYISVTFWTTLEKAESYEKSEMFKNLIDRTKQFLSGSAEWKIQLSDNMELEYAPVDDEPVIKKFLPSVNDIMSDDFELPNSQLYVRILYLKIMEKKIDKFKSLFSDIIIPELKSVKGCRNIFLSESLNAPNEFVSVTIWNSKEYAERYETGGKFDELVAKVRHTFSQFYLWKMTLQNDYKAKVKTSDDLKIEHYSFVTGKNFK